MPIRNPFKRSSNLEPQDSGTAELGFRDASVIGAKPTDFNEPVEVQLSEIDNSGVFIPPPTTDKTRFWPTRSNSSLESSIHRSVFSENEPFNMSRESFDSYRRSFDISARSPIPFSDTDSLRRPSLESSLVLSLRERRKADWPEDQADDDTAPFEDVILSEAAPKPTPAKKRGLFARFNTDSDNAVKQQHPSGIHGIFPGRKRAQSSQGAELKAMTEPLKDLPSVVVVAE